MLTKQAVPLRIEHAILLVCKGAPNIRALIDFTPNLVARALRILKLSCLYTTLFSVPPLQTISTADSLRRVLKIFSFLAKLIWLG